MSQVKSIIFFVHLIFGLYIFNLGLNFIVLPESLTKFNEWMFLIGGILILIGGINYLRAGRRANLIGQ